MNPIFAKLGLNHQMGIVKKQGIQSGIIIYIGFLLAAFNVMYFFPRFFTPEEFGLTRVLLAAATTFAQFALYSGWVKYNILIA